LKLGTYNSNFGRAWNQVTRRSKTTALPSRAGEAPAAGQRQQGWLGQRVIVGSAALHFRLGSFVSVLFRSSVEWCRH
jgi:hypothetical protein